MLAVVAVAQPEEGPARGIVLVVMAVAEAAEEGSSDGRCAAVAGARARAAARAALLVSRAGGLAAMRGRAGEAARTNRKAVCKGIKEAHRVPSSNYSHGSLCCPVVRSKADRSEQGPPRSLRPPCALDATQVLGSGGRAGTKSKSDRYPHKATACVLALLQTSLPR